MHLLTNLLHRIRQWPRATAVAAVIGMLGFAWFLNITEDVLTGDSALADRWLLWRAHLLAQSPDGRWLTPVARICSALGNWHAAVPLGLLLAILAWRQQLSWRTFTFYLAGCGGAGGLVLLFKHLVSRPRPDIVPSLDQAPFASFPSGHAAYALVIYGYLAYLTWRRTALPRWAKRSAAVAAAGLALLVGASRVYLATHYPSDVVAGYLIGIAWLVALAIYWERLEDALPAGEPRAVSHGPAR